MLIQIFAEPIAASDVPNRFWIAVSSAIATSTCSSVAGGFVSNSPREGTNIFLACLLHSKCARSCRVCAVRGRARAGSQAHRRQDERDRAPRTGGVRSGRGQLLRTSCYSLVLATAFSEVVQNFKHSGTAFDGFVQMKNEMRRVFQYHVAREFGL